MVQQNIHGGDIYRNQVSLDFSVNVNPFGMPQRVREALEAAVAWCERYPDIRSEALRDAIAGAKGIAPADIVCGNGASELFPAILRAVHAKKVLLAVPSFYGYEHAAKSVGAEICCHELLEADGYAVTERFLTAIGEDVDAVFLAVPNNPVGTVVEPELLEKIAERCQKNGVTLILDECFVTFTGEEERYSFLKKYRNYPGVVIVRAFTKLYAMPGVRLGYLVCRDIALTEAVRGDLPEWNLSVFAQQAGCVACGQRAYVKHSVTFVCRERDWLREQLLKIGITVFASNANFLMIKDGRPLAKELLKKGILIRDCSNYRGLSGGYYRIAVRRREENERLLAALVQVTGSSVVENGKEDKKPAAVPDGIEYVMPQEIEKRSFSIIEEELQLRGDYAACGGSNGHEACDPHERRFFLCADDDLLYGSGGDGKVAHHRGCGHCDGHQHGALRHQQARARTLRRIGTLLYGGRGCGKRGEGAGRHPRHREHGTGGKDRKTGHLCDRKCADSLNPAIRDDRGGLPPGVHHRRSGWVCQCGGGEGTDFTDEDTAYCKPWKKGRQQCRGCHLQCDSLRAWEVNPCAMDLRREAAPQRRQRRRLICFLPAEKSTRLPSPRQKASSTMPGWKRSAARSIPCAALSEKMAEMIRTSRREH